MRLADFDYDLPAGSIAQQPLEPRDAARLLVDRGTSAAEHAHVRDLTDHLGDGDVVVVNDTKVIPARLRLVRHGGGGAEVLLLEPLDGDQRTWEALARPARKLRPGECLYGDDGSAVVEIGRRTPAGDTVEVTVLGEDPLATMQRVGEMPLPPYLRAGLARADRYQTVYANQPGSAAAPTAGLHFTAELLAAIERRGVAVHRVALFVGLDTFKPITTPDLLQHVMHSERYAVGADVLAACSEARRVVAIGTTSVRALESAAATSTLRGRTTIFIHRPYEWKVVDVLMTNFHLPRTTLLMMIDAFVGSRWRRLYELALDDGYRFLSFGDAMLLDRSAQ